MCAGGCGGASRRACLSWNSASSPMRTPASGGSSKRAPSLVFVRRSIDTTSDHMCKSSPIPPGGSLVDIHDEIGAAAARDDADLARFGYKQDLRRSLGIFSSFHVPLSYISHSTYILAPFYLGLTPAC